MLNKNACNRNELIETPNGTYVRQVSPTGYSNKLDFEVADALPYKSVSYSGNPVDGEGYHPPSSRLFDRPELYEKIFGWDNQDEIDFLLSHLPSAPEHRIMEFGCGNGRILTELNSHGLHVDGIDSSLPAVEYILDRVSSSADYRPTVIFGDITEIAVPRVYMAAFAALNTIRYLPSIGALKSHLLRAGSTVNPGGMYLVHLDTFGQETPPAPVGEGTEWMTDDEASSAYRVEWSLANRIDYSEESIDIELVRITHNGEEVIREHQAQLSMPINEWTSVFEASGLWKIDSLWNETSKQKIEVSEWHSAPQDNYWFKLRRTDVKVPPLFNA